MFNERLKKLRQNSKLTQQKLALALDLSPGTIGMYEQGRRTPDFDTLVKIADYFDVSTDFLLERVTAKPSKNSIYTSTNELQHIEDLNNNIPTQVRSSIFDIINDMYLILNNNSGFDYDQDTLNTVIDTYKSLNCILLHLINKNVSNCSYGNTTLDKAFNSYSEHKNTISISLDKLFSNCLVNSSSNTNKAV